MSSSHSVKHPPMLICCRIVSCCSPDLVMIRAGRSSENLIWLRWFIDIRKDGAAGPELRLYFSGVRRLEATSFSRSFEKQKGRSPAAFIYPYNRGSRYLRLPFFHNMH